MTRNTSLRRLLVAVVAAAAAAVSGVVGTGTAMAATASYWTIVVVNDSSSTVYGARGIGSNVDAMTPTIAPNSRGRVIGKSRGGVAENIDFRYSVDAALYERGVNVQVRMKHGDEEGAGELTCMLDMVAPLLCQNATIPADVKSVELHIRD